MSGRRHGNTNPVGQRNSNVHNETSSRNASRFKWTYEQEKTLIELYDQAISMNDYTLKDPTVLGREHMVDNFNRAFNLNINYAFFKNKLDDFKKAYKKWKFLMTSTGITVNPETSMIYASDEWWEARESGCKITRSFKRQPPPFWDVMVRCFVLHDVYSQPQQSSRQRRQQILTEGIEEDDLFDFSDNDGDDIPQHNVPQTQENEEIYRVNLNADTLPSHEYTQESTRLPSRRGEERTRRGGRSERTGGRGSTSQTSARNSGTNVGSTSRGHRRRQSFETTIQDTINGYKEFQRQSLQQLCPGAFDKDDYDEFKKAEQIFLALELPKFTKFYWACINALKELVFWRKYFIDIARSNDEDKLQLLEAMTGVSRNNEDVPKQLGSGQLFGRNNFQNLGAPPTTQQWGTPPNVQHWGTPPNMRHWGTPPNVQYWGTSPNAQPWDSSPKVHQSPSTSIGFTNYFEPGNTSQRPRRGGLFNIWRTTEEPNEENQSGSGDEE
ncbi:unnamed protein product [Brassica rapa]|uniref:Myb/SANT-like domain-containing protein n=1 Tax=Brassica campestris TaxID=3711 RepID=A0A8D9MF27_BRACM|nr:unnamed protein product [Brassica rapa]